MPLLSGRSKNIIMPVAIITTTEKSPCLALFPNLGMPDQINQKDPGSMENFRIHS